MIQPVHNLDEHSFPDLIIENGNVIFGNDLPFVLIAGPCQIESRQHALEMAEALSYIAKEMNIGFVYKLPWSSK
mgnify:CR=1 FL=1